MDDLFRLFRAEWVKLWKHRLSWWLLLALLVVLVLQVRGLYAQVRDEPSTAQKVDEYVQAHVEAWPQWDMSVAVLIAREGEILVSKGYGLANRETQMPVTPDTIFPLASISKQFTAMAVMQLQEAGLLSVDDPLSTYYPEYPRSDEITLHHLLTHSSGLPNATALFVPGALEFDPGAHVSYSNLNYILLGRIVEQVSGQSLGDYLQEHVFGPLDMRSSGFDPATVAERATAALGYARGRNGPEPLMYPSLEHAGGAGALYSTIRDLYLWDRALYTDQLACQSTIERVFASHLPYENNSMGYGWVIGTLAGHPVAMHGGFMPGATGIVARFMEDDAVIIVLSNTDWAPVNLIVEGLAEIVFGEYYELPARHTASLIDLDPSVFDRYEGEYALPGMGMSLTAQRDRDRFYLHLRTRTDEQTIELYPTSQTSFVADLGDTEIEFVLDEAGAADRLKVISAGQTLVAMRLGVDAPPSVGPTSDQARLLSALQAGISYNERFCAATLPGVLARVPHLYDWLLVAIVLLGVVSVGQEFAWGTVRAALARGVPRGRFVLAKFLVLSAWVACCLLILWVACAVLGVWTTRSLKGAVDWSFIDQAFWREQLGALARTWLIALSTVALTLAIQVWVGRPGPAFGLSALGYFFSLISYFFLISLPLFVMMHPDADAAAFGGSFWVRLIELLPHYNSRVVAHWGEPSRMYEMDYSAWTISQLLHLRYDPWYASGLLALYGLVPLLWAMFSFRRREMTS